MRTRYSGFKTRLGQLPAIFGLALAMLWSVAAQAQQLTVSADAYTDLSKVTSNFGSTQLLRLSPTQTPFLRFDLSGLPGTTQPSQIAKATLVLWPQTVDVAGAVEVQAVNADWNEATLSGSNTPPTSGRGSGPSVTVTESDKYVRVDVTGLVRGWLANPGTNFGIALAPAATDSNIKISFDSKESRTTSHVAYIDVVFTQIPPVPVCVGPGKILQFDGAGFLCVSGQATVYTSTVNDANSAFGCAGAGWQGLHTVVITDPISRTVVLTASNLRADYAWSNRGFTVTATDSLPVGFNFANGRDNIQLQVTTSGQLLGACKTGGSWSVLVNNVFGTPLGQTGRGSAATRR
ncbi:DNRLRE domain-containing protein [Ideonella alba]|uniref:DNRLRE domain-containing protein n=1 Tax=Ideonella alba TaxID=2824118 RepID=A0A941BMV4_9BURK|nr:DNRLRE domain-containing protein [Ideonella alba]MBQ0932659.1 DNRLRE domain-containing protein [Ideonella alba]